MARIDVPTETLLVELGDEGLNILETTLQMSSKDENTPVICDLCSKPLGKMQDVKHLVSPETITSAVRKGFKPEQMLKATKVMLQEQGEENPDEILKIVFESWKSIVDKSETPWALCEDCYKNVQIFIKKQGSSSAKV
jgi:hypothetical protein